MNTSELGLFDIQCNDSLSCPFQSRIIVRSGLSQTELVDIIDNDDQDNGQMDRG